MLLFIFMSYSFKINSVGEEEKNKNDENSYYLLRKIKIF